MERLRRAVRTSALVLATLAFGACATTSTYQASLDPEVVRAEEEKQRQLALETHAEQQARLTNIAYRLSRAAVPLCEEDVAPRSGLRFANVYNYERNWREAARAALGVGDTLQVVTVAADSPADRAGLAVGDRLVSLNGEPLETGATAAERLDARLEEVEKSGAATVEIRVRRGAGERVLVLELEEMCRYPAVVLPESSLNAFADGDRVYVTSAMMRFTTDEELSVVLAHEIAHNAMGHIDARKDNALFGALLGALGDIALAAAGVNTGGYYASQGAEIGVQAYSQDFEREADYVGLYILAVSEMDEQMDEAPRFWRLMAQANPESIGFASTHPTTAERFVRMEQTLEEIARKRLEGEPLQPEMKEDAEGR